MFDTIILLTGTQEQAALARVLGKHNSLLTVKPVATLAEVVALKPKLLRDARLVAFSTGVVVPPHVLHQLGYGAYNFHPGPPEFPGWGPAHFAILRGATEFGATAHRMIEAVDAGEIVGVERFSISPGIGIIKLEELAYSHLVKLFWRMAQLLATRAEPLPNLPIWWSSEKCTRRRYATMCGLPTDCTKDELDSRIRTLAVTHHSSSENGPDHIAETNRP